MHGKYILNDNGEPVECRDLMTWAKWLQTAKRHVGDEMIDGVRVSTVFLGLDHCHNDGPPILWETMTFSAKNEPMDQACDRCSGNWEQAEAMHEAMVAVVRAELASRKEAMAGVYDALAEAGTAGTGDAFTPDS